METTVRYKPYFKLSHGKKVYLNNRITHRVALAEHDVKMYEMQGGIGETGIEKITTIIEEYSPTDSTEQSQFKNP